MKGYFTFIIILILSFFTLSFVEKEINAKNSYHKDRNTEKLPVLMYHTFDDKPKFPEMNTTSEMFKAQLTLLKDNGYTAITSDELNLYKLGKLKLPDRSFMITIDDGYESVYHIAYPILKEMEMKATLFVITSHVESGERFGVPMLSWKQLKEMSDSGFIEVGNHTHDLHWRGENNTPGREAMIINITKDGAVITDVEREQNIIKDLKNAHELIKKNVGVPPKAFAYPYGAYDQIVENAVKKAGYTRSYTVIEGVNYLNDNTSNIKRFNITNDVSPTDILKKINSYSD